MILKPICIWLQSCMVLVAVGEFLSSHATKHKRILSKWFFISNCGFQWKRKGDSNAILWSVSDRKSENRQVTMFPQVVASFLGAAAASWPPRPWPGPWPGSVLVARSPGPVAGLGAGPGASARSTRPPWARPWSGPRARPATATAAAATTPLALFKDPYPSASKLRTIQLVKSIPKICCASKSFKLMSIAFCRKIELTPCRRATQTQQLPLHSDSKKNIYSYNCSRKKFMLRLHLMSVCVVDFACLAHEILQVLQKCLFSMPFRSKKNTKKVLIESKLGNLPRGRGWEVFNHHAVSGPGTRWLKCNWWRKTLMTQSQSKLTLLPPNPPLSRSPKSRRPPPPPPPPPLPLVCSTRILLPSRSFPSRSLTTSSASRRSSNSANPNPSWKQNQCHSKVLDFLRSSSYSIFSYLDGDVPDSSIALEELLNIPDKNWVSTLM